MTCLPLLSRPSHQIISSAPMINLQTSARLIDQVNCRHIYEHTKARHNNDTMSSMIELPSSDVLQHVVDVHCHPTDAPRISPESMEQLRITICAMACREKDQTMVGNLATAYPSKVIPCFGYHPYFSYYITMDPTVSKDDHYRRLFLDPLKTTTPADQEAFDRLLSLLPSPRPLNAVLSEMRQNLGSFPNAMIGEIGLDKPFKVPYDYDASPRELTPFAIPLDHQLSIVEAQIDLAVELRRNVSLHSVCSQQATVDLLDRLAQKHGDSFYAISIDIHSCSLNLDTWKAIEIKHNNIFLSLSAVHNGSLAYRKFIAACADDRLLAESDYFDIDMCTSQTWSIVKIIAESKNWMVESVWAETPDEKNWGVVRRLRHNWHRFRDGGHTSPGRQC